VDESTKPRKNADAKGKNDNKGEKVKDSTPDSSSKK
jgi:hypothetical protein